MSYADVTYYKDTYKGLDPGDDAEISKFLERATDDINAVCGGLFEEDSVYSQQWTLLKKANCAQADWYLQNGETYNDEKGQSVKVGQFSHSGGSGAGSLAGILSSRANMYLNQSGLCHAAVNVGSSREC